MVQDRRAGKDQTGAPGTESAAPGSRAATARPWQDRRRRSFIDRLHILLAGLARPATGFTSQPEPRSIGLHARGRQLTSGNFLLAGALVEAPDTVIWDIPMPDAEFCDATHGFAWLDDLAAVGTLPAQERAQKWVFEWIARYGRGKGAGWTPDLTGRRLIRWINHTTLLLAGRPPADSHAFFASLTRQTVFLSRRWGAAAPGLPRFEALAGLVHAGLSLTGMERRVTAASTSSLSPSAVSAAGWPMPLRRRAISSAPSRPLI